MNITTYQMVKGVDPSLTCVQMCVSAGTGRAGSFIRPTLQPLPGTQRLQGEVLQWSQQEGQQGGQ